MPIYQYECETCGHQFEKHTKKINDKHKSCTKCGKRAKKLISVSSFVINGYSEKNGYSKKE